ncbi:MAG TPA: CvpA family protein [Alphaproteobacteria bacterium]
MEQQTVNLVDLGVALVVLVSAVFAFYRGFVRETLAIAGWVGAAVVTYYFFTDARSYVAEYIADEFLVNVATGAGLFLAALVALWLVIHLIVIRVKDSPLNALDRSLGFLFGVARGVVVVALAYMVGEMTLWDDADHPRPEWLEDARSRPLIDYAAGLIVAVTPKDFLNLPIEKLSEMRNARGLTGGNGSPGTPSEVEQLSRPPVAAGAPTASDPGYRDSESQEMDRLIDSLKDKPAAEGQGSQ